MPNRIQLKRTKGWKMPPNTVKVDRTTKWGNPFQVGKPGGVYSACVMNRRHAWQLFRALCPILRPWWQQHALSFAAKTSPAGVLCRRNLMSRTCATQRCYWNWPTAQTTVVRHDRKANPLL